MRKKIILVILLLLFGAAILLWPKFHGAMMNHQMAETVEEFISVSDSYPGLHEAMETYNKAIYHERQVKLRSLADCEKSVIELKDYGVTDEVAGVLEVPAMKLTMPLYLGASNEHLALGAAQMGQTSMPIGGENTNCVIAGHRGWNGADYFRYIDTLQNGDDVIIHNLWDTLHYKVTEIKIISPSAVGELLIQQDKDMVTLLSCHPYASGGRMRYAVFCERTNN